VLRICVAAMMVAAVGCGTSPRARPDAEMPDSDVDGVGDAMDRGLVSVTVNSSVRLTRLENAPVVFIEPDGTTTRVMTDVMGHAEATVKPGTSVTVVFEEKRGIATILGARPGDQLVFGRGRLIDGTSFDLTFTAFSGDADTYYVSTPGLAHQVSPGTTHVTLDLCSDSITNANLLVVAYKDFVPVATVAARSRLTTARSQSRTLDAMSSLVLDYSSVPQFQSVYAGYVDMPEHYNLGTNANAPTYDVTFPVPSTASSAYVQTSFSRTRGHQEILEPLPTGATSYQLNVGAALQPWLSEISYTKATRTVAVQGIGGQSFDVVAYGVAFGLPSSSTWWTVFSPDLNGVVLPTLPADLDPTTTPVVGVNVETYEVPMLNGWDEVRPQVYPLITPHLEPVLPFGRVHLQTVRDQ
jgi:hypothetical protein